MKQRKTMKLWQMLVLAAICLGLLLDMFLPLWNINGTKMVDWYVDMAEEVIEEDVDIPGINNRLLKDALDYQGDDKQEKLNEWAEQMDQAVEKMEEAVGINIGSLSGIGYVTMDVNAFLIGDKEYTQNDLEKFEKKLEEKDSKDLVKAKQQISNAKVAFATEYYRTGIILLLILLGFFLKWSKRIVSIISAVFGFLTMGFYALIWWGTPWFMLNEIEDKVLAEQLQPVIKSLWSSIVGMGIIVGFILGLLLLVMGIVTCIVGQREIEVIDDFNNNIFYDRNNDVQRNIWDNQNQTAVFDHNNLNRNGNENKEDNVVLKPPKPKAGQVKCTQGAAMGQGFKLPEDRKVIVGKSPQNATLVIHDQHVSNVHCSIRYRAETNSYIVKDHSTNGTFVQGVRLAKDIAVEYPAGTVLSLADGSNKITLG